MCRGCGKVVKSGWQVVRPWTHYQHKTITSRSRQLLMMGTWLPETCWATIRREIKNTKNDIGWFFLSTLNYDARSTTNQLSNFMWLLFRNLGASSSWKLEALSKPLQGLLYLYPSFLWRSFECSSRKEWKKLQWRKPECHNGVPLQLAVSRFRFIIRVGNLQLVLWEKKDSELCLMQGISYNTWKQCKITLCCSNEVYCSQDGWYS